MTLVRRGIPEQYGIFYAMGGALSMEGILSACYHICPTKVNFQFDTTFMYVISVLVFLKVYQVGEERMTYIRRVSSEQRPGNFQADPPGKKRKSWKLENFQYAKIISRRALGRFS